MACGFYYKASLLNLNKPENVEISDLVLSDQYLVSDGYITFMANLS